MNGELRLLVTHKPVEFDKSPVDVEDFRKITDHSRGLYARVKPQINKGKIKKSYTCNSLDLETLRLVQRECNVYNGYYANIKGLK